MDIMIVLVLLAAYFLPAVVASMRGHRNATAIFVLNIFLGWTFLGWVIALVWACTADRDAAATAAAPMHRQPPLPWRTALRRAALTWLWETAAIVAFIAIAIGAAFWFKPAPAPSVAPVLHSNSAQTTAFPPPWAAPIRRTQ